MGREKTARRRPETLLTTGSKNAGKAAGGSGRLPSKADHTKLHLSEAERSLADRGHMLDEQGDAWWRRIGAADSKEEFLKFWTQLRPEFRDGPVPPPDGTNCKRCKMHVNLSRKPATWNNTTRSRKNCDGGCWGQESVNGRESRVRRKKSSACTIGTRRAAPTRTRTSFLPKRWSRPCPVMESSASTARPGREG